MKSNRVFWMRGHITGFRALGWQFDYRIDGWLPFSIRLGKRRPNWRVYRIRGRVFTVGKVTQP